MEVLSQFSFSWLWLGTALVLFEVGWIVYALYFHPLADIPGPFLAKISRLWIMADVFKGHTDDTQRELHKKYGKIVRIAPNEVIISDPGAVKVIYAVNAGFSKTDFYPPFAPHLSKYGDHFTQLDERMHSDRRRIVNHLYSMSNVLQSEPYVDACTHLWRQRMSQFADSGETVDLGEWLQMYAFDVVGELFFGKMFGFMENKHDYGTYIESLDTLLPFVAVALVMPSYMRVLIHAGPIYPALRRALNAYNNIVIAAKGVVRERQALMERGEAKRSDLLDSFFQISRKDPTFGNDEITTECFVAIFAGSDTTAIAMRSVLYNLMKHPKTYRKLQEEIDIADAQGLLSKPVKYAEGMKLPYFVACCKEGMRVHPSVGMSMPRHVPKGGKEIAGRFFPGGSRVGVNGAVLHFDKSIFGDDAHEWNPDRWLRNEEQVKIMERHMLHFGAGTRTCIGKNISLCEIHKMLPDFLRDFDIKLVDQDKVWTTHNSWFHKQMGLNVKVTRR